MPKAKTNRKPVRMKSNWKNKLIPIIGILLFGVAGTVLVSSLFAAPSPLSFSLYSTHPYASNAGFNSTSTNYYTGQQLCAISFCPTGQTITDMEVTAEGQLVAGYGDWNANVDSFGVPEGRVGVVPLDLNTNTWGAITVAGSEALDTVRKINGKLYLPTTDPSDTLGSKSGYITNESGSWQLKQDNASGEHIFDVATYNGTDRWETGSGQGGAAAYRSANNDGVWTPTVSVAGDWARWYWSGNLNGKLYIGSLSNNTTYGTAGTQVFDGVKWTKENLEPCYTTSAKTVVSYGGKIVCPSTTYNTLSIFDGNSVKNMTVSGSVRDFYVDGTTLYMLNTSGAVYQFSSLTAAPVLVGQADYQANTVAVHNGYMYLGYPAGQIYRSNGVIGSSTTPTPPATGTMTAIATSPSTLALDRSKKTIAIDGTGFPTGVAVTVGGQATTLISSTPTKVTVEFDAAKYIRSQRLRASTTLTLPVQLSASGYPSVYAPSIAATYTK